jgi:predicted  nucleic acid-binding Zn-ribbon protein
MASLGKALPSVSEALQTYSIQLASSTSSQNNFNEANEKLLLNFNALDQSIGTLQSSSSNVAKVLNENFTNIDLTNFNEFIKQLSDSTKTIKNISDQAIQLSASIQGMHQTIGTGIIDSKESLMLQAKDLQEATELLNGAMIGLAKSMQAAAKEMTK